MAMQYKKILKSKAVIKQNMESSENAIPDDDSDDKNVNTTQTNSFITPMNTPHNDLEFLDSHPGKHFCKLAHLKILVIPMLFDNGAQLFTIFA
jgi:hypothetical protein